MNQLKKIVFTVIFLLASTAALALPEAPKQCPSAASILATGFDLDHGQYGNYVATKISNYNTSQQWSLLMVLPGSMEEAQALKLAKTLHGNPPPVPLDPVHWICFYAIDSNGPYQVGALTPPIK